ncbi:aminoacetone oxidase family FAD-binding enzyme [Candidatus Kaiserbacteria bacterium]|nr:aminoacetone oxidase family FAD-binding enzyme [Candidatus Kaiserbacteria bacterium]
MSTKEQYDVIVIGGGPSGMMAAGRAAECGRRVLLIEKNKDLGKKLSITGGGRCNIFNVEEDEHKLLENYGDAAKFLYSAFSQHGMKDSLHFFEEKGLPIVVEARKRAFPESQNAEDVTRLMKRYVTGNHVELKTGTKVLGFKIDGEKIIGVETNNGILTAESFVLATGGSSHTDTGSTGEGITWLKKIGHTVHPSSPNIVPLTVLEEWVKALSGTSLSFMKITFGSNLTKATGRFSRLGKILFTHFGVSGPLILNAAHDVEKLLTNGPVEATIDMYPDTDMGVLQNRVLEIFNTHKNKTLKNILKEFVPVGMSEAVAVQFPLELQETKVHSVSKLERRTIVNLLKAMPLTITGTMGMDWAVTSDGGVDLKEVDTKTMRSKLYSNLYVTGDVLHINRPSGGFSLQLCWTTGYVAGSHV